MIFDSVCIEGKNDLDVFRSYFFQIEIGQECQK